MRNPAIDAFAEIRANRDRIRAEETQKCPTVPSKSLYNCLREAVRCPVTCPHHGDWIGPQPEVADISG